MWWFLLTGVPARSMIRRVSREAILPPNTTQSEPATPFEGTAVTRMPHGLVAVTAATGDRASTVATAPSPTMLPHVAGVSWS